MTKAQAISARIIAKLGEGMPLREAFDSVLGAGRFQQFADELYDALREVRSDPQQPA